MSSAALFLRVDASPRIGAGHFVRCLSLAQAWCDSGGEAVFVGSAPDALLARLAEDGIGHVEPADEADALSSVTPGALAMLDGYHFGYETQLAFARRARKLLVVDDTAEAPRLAGHVLLNQNPGAESLPYGEAPPERLLGPRYALLGRRFRLAQRREGREPALAERVLVTFGGADPDNVTLAVLEALEPELPAHVRVLVGPANPHHGSLARWTASRRNVELLRGATDLPAVMRWADLAVAAPGTTVFELAWLGVPMLLTAIASNQLGSGASLSESGAALYCGPFGPAAAAELRSQFRALLRDPSRRASLARTARSLIDGRGAERVANVLRS